MLFTYEDYQAGKCTYREYYKQLVVESNARQLVLERFTVEELKKAYARDEHFNDMPRCGGTLYPFCPNLGTWDTMGRRLICPWEKFGEFETLAARVCVLKCAAAMIATE